jgi:hypothetical protein
LRKLASLLERRAMPHAEWHAFRISAIGDLDKDGWPDIAVARSGAPNVIYFSTGVRQCEK